MLMILFYNELAYIFQILQILSCLLLKQFVNVTIFVHQVWIQQFYRLYFTILGIGVLSF